MGAALFRGDLGAAFVANPVVLVGLAVAVVAALLWTVELLGGPTVRPPAALRNAVRRVRPFQWLAVLLTASALFVVLRNLL